MASVLKTFKQTIAATNAIVNLPPNCFAVLLRCPLANAGTTYLSIDESPANATYSSSLVAGESITLDLSNAIMLAAQYGIATQEKFIRFVSCIGTASDILIIDALTWV